MILTEEEAREKQCCGPDGCGTNIQIGFVDFGDGTGKSTWERRCIASECMAWRWKMSLSQPERHLGVGFCGLAGKAE